MSIIKGWPSQSALERLPQHHATIEPVHAEQHAMSVLAHSYVYEVATDAAEAGSTKSTIVATAHVALVGDVIRITSGADSDIEVKVAAVSANAIILAEDLPVAMSAADTFVISRHRYPKVGPDGALSLTAGPIRFNLDGGEVEVTEDTVTPANNIPLPVKLTSVTGDINITAGDLNVHLSHAGANYDSTRIGDGTTLAGVTVSNELKTSDTTAQTSLTAISGKLPATLGQKTSANSLAVVLASDQSTVAVSAESLPLPTGAATESTLATRASESTLSTLNGKVTAVDTDNVIIIASALPWGASTESTLASLNSKVTAVNTGAVVVSSSALPTGAATETTLAALNTKVTAVDTGAVVVSSSALPAGAATETTLAAANAKLPATLGQTTSSASLAVVLASDQSLIATSQRGRSVVTTVRNNYSSTNVTTGAWVELVASTGAVINELSIFDSSGQTLELGTGAAASETRLILVFPGGNGTVPVAIPAATRISIRAVSANATVGEFTANFLG